jgi:hypothetical protein
MKKAIVGLILGAFLIALFTSPTFANPGPPNPNAPYQNVRDIEPTLNESGWGEVNHVSSNRNTGDGHNSSLSGTEYILSDGNIFIQIIWLELRNHFEFGISRNGKEIRHTGDQGSGNSSSN